MKQPTPPNPFGITENKSAASLATEAKAAVNGDDTEEPDMANAAPLTPPTDEPDAPEAEADEATESDTIEIVLVHHLNIVGPGGKVTSKVPGDTVTLPRALGLALSTSVNAELPAED